MQLGSGICLFAAGAPPVGPCPYIHQVGIKTVLHLIISVTWYKVRHADTQILCRVGWALPCPPPGGAT